MINTQMNNEINDYLIEYGFTLDNRKILKQLVELPKWVDGDLYKLNFYEHIKLQTSMIRHYFVYLPNQGRITIYESVESSYGNYINHLHFSFDSIDSFKIVLNSIIIHLSI